MAEAFKEINEIKQIIDELGKLNVNKKTELVKIRFISNIEFFLGSKKQNS